MWQKILFSHTKIPVLEQKIPFVSCAKQSSSVIQKKKKVIPVMKQKILFLSRDTDKNNAQHTAYRLLVPTWGRTDEGVVWLVYSHVAQRMKYDNHTRCALLALACCTCMQSPSLTDWAFHQVQCCFTSTENIRDGHIDFHTAPELSWVLTLCKGVQLQRCLKSTETIGLLGTVSPGRPFRLSHSSWARTFQERTGNTSTLLIFEHLCAGFGLAVRRQAGN